MGTHQPGRRSGRPTKGMGTGTPVDREARTRKRDVQKLVKKLQELKFQRASKGITSQTLEKLWKDYRAVRVELGRIQKICSSSSRGRGTPPAMHHLRLRLNRMIGFCDRMLESLAQEMRKKLASA